MERIDSVLRTLYASNDEGRVSVGACRNVRFPVPEIFTVYVAAELALICAGGISAEIVNSPTAPVKDAGAPDGSSFTLTVMAPVESLRLTLYSSTPPPKKGSKLRAFCMTTRATAVISVGSMVSEPLCCG